MFVPSYLISFERNIAAIVLMCVAQLAIAQQADETVADDPKIAAIKEKYASEFKKLEDQGQNIPPDETPTPEPSQKPIVTANFKITSWHNASFDVPEFRMKRQHIALDLPTVVMKTHHIRWGNPEVRMENRVVGSYPEFHGFTVRWKHIITKVPVTRIVQREASLGVPEFSMHRDDMSFDEPEVFRTRRVSFKVPNIKLESAHGSGENATPTPSPSEEVAGSKDIEDSATALAIAERKELAATSITALEKHRADLQTQQVQSIGQIAEAIKKTKEAGVNPADVKLEDGKKLNLSTELESVSKQFSDALKQIDDAIAQLGSEEPPGGTGAAASPSP